MNGVPFRDVFWLITLALVWGSSFAAIKVAVETMPPMTMVAVRTVIALCMLLPMMIAQGARLPSGHKKLVYGLCSGCIRIGAAFLPYWLGRETGGKWTGGHSDGGHAHRDHRPSSFFRTWRSVSLAQTGWYSSWVFWGSGPSWAGGAQGSGWPNLASTGNRRCRNLLRDQCDCHEKPAVWRDVNWAGCYGHDMRCGDLATFSDSARWRYSRVRCKCGKYLDNACIWECCRQGWLH